ncbi:MAG: tyrosine-type recombinase/integrase [Bacteroidia bacterium]|nr:tyrosine-type recombinase/integrase [Bacteroidia bacterium]MDW8015122.1 tyrosine-type recombinase/integrase [Bacteroidia bacterium]
MLEQFLKYLQEIRRASPHTVSAYCRDLRQWQAFCKRHYDIDPLQSPLSWAQVSPLHLRAWLSLYKHLATRARKVAALRRMDKYIRQVLGERGLSWRIRTPRYYPSLPKALPESQLLPLLGRMDEIPLEFSSLRDRLLIELLYGCGLRRSEALSLRLAQIHPQQLHILGKGNKWRVLPLYPRLEQLLQAYMFERSKLSPSHDYLLCNSKGKPLSPRAAHRIVRLRLGTHPHALRHSFATHLLKRGAHIQAIRDLLGHESLATTQRYIAITPDDLRAAYKKFHPRA